MNELINTLLVAGGNETGGDLYVLLVLCFAAAFPEGALVIVVSPVVRCVLVWRLANKRNGGEGERGW